MRLRSSSLFLLLILAVVFTGGSPLAWAQRQPDPTAGHVPLPTPPPPPTPQPGASQPGASRQPGMPEETAGGGYLFRKRVEEVQLHATVVDQKQRLITNLDRSAFTVYEDGKPQQLTSFRREDIPVALGIVIDNSGSMREKRAAVNQAALNLVRASNPRDEVFIVNFNDDAWLDQDFTSDIGKLKEGLEHIESRGGTALYDAVVAAADHLEKGGKLEKKVILVVTDGEDNASRENLEQAIRKLQDENGPSVYSIGILGDDREAHRAKRALTALALQTGGVAFFPKDISEVDNISRAVAHDLRNQYTLGYRPSNPQSNGGYRSVHVEAHAGGYGKLQVRTRTGYYATQERASNVQ